MTLAIPIGMNTNTMSFGNGYASDDLVPSYDSALCFEGETVRKKATSAVAEREQETPAHRLHLVGTTDRETDTAEFDDPDAANDSLELDSSESRLTYGDAHSETEQSRESDSAEDLVGVYLREMGVTPMLTREGEAALALRIERGCRRTAKAVSRMPICIEEILAIGNRLKAGELHIREVINFRDQEDITEVGIQECLNTTIASIAEIASEYKVALRIYGKVQAEPKSSK